MTALSDRRPLPLATKIKGFVLLIVGLVAVLITASLSYILINWQFRDSGQDALALAKTVAVMPQVVDAFHTPDPSAIIQPIAEKIREQAGAEFIVVGNMQLIRYSHPNSALIGQKMVGDDDDLVLSGQESVTQAVGTLGLSVRGKAPVYDANHRQIGVVSVGFLVHNIWNQVIRSLIELSLVGLVGLVVGLVGANLLAGHIKREIFNMEPAEIALLTQKQAAILESIREGILAVDGAGKITAMNVEARRLLGLDLVADVIGQPVDVVVPNSRLTEVLEDGLPHRDQPMIFGNSLVVVNRVPVLLHAKVIGAVATIRDKMELDQIDDRLADVGRYVDALRSQRHEFMNKLHTVSGLIELQEYDLAHEVILQVNHEQQRVLEFFMSRLRDSAVVGILTGKLHRAKELGIELEVDSISQLPDHCPHREVVITLLGNAIENALEALSSWTERTRDPKITVLVRQEAGTLLLRVADNGPGIDPNLGARVFEDGVSTKGTGRGFGLALLSKLVATLQGELALYSSSEGATLEAKLPVREEELPHESATDSAGRRR